MKDKKKKSKKKQNVSDEFKNKKEEIIEKQKEATGKVIEETPAEEIEEKTTETVEETPIEENISEKENDKTEEYIFYRPTISSSTYGETVDNLVKEVQLFHEEGDIEIPKKSKLWLIVGIILFVIIVSIFAYLLINNNNKKDNKKDNNINNDITYDYNYKEFDDRIEFYDGDKLIDTYTCMSEKCSVYSLGRYSYFGVKPTIMAIYDDKSVFLYNYIEKKTTSALYTQLQNLIKEDETVAFIAYGSDNLVGIIDINGNVIVPLEYDAIGYSMNGGDVSDYSYEHDIISAKQDGLWGLISLSDGSTILDLQYDDIYYNGLNNVVTNIEGSWYLLNLKGEKILAEGYDMIIPTKSYIFVSSKGLFNILNYKGNNIISKEIPTYIGSFRARNKSITPAFKLEVDGTIININIMKSETNYIEYKFNTVNGELTEVIK